VLRDALAALATKGLVEGAPRPNRRALAAGAPVPEVITLAPIATVRGTRAAMVLAAAAGRALAELEPAFSLDQRAEAWMMR